jgi:D-arabinose 1-dehydrogenase-like Zn-dependent alcohol dehydrogenase
MVAPRLHPQGLQIYSTVRYGRKDCTKWLAGEQDAQIARLLPYRRKHTAPASHRMTPRTYLAVRAVGHGRLEFTRLPVARPSEGQVRIRVEACGICRLDSATVEGTFPGLVYPRIPGHEVVGRIEARGVGVSDYAIGARVAVGALAWQCGHCVPCLRGEVSMCTSAPVFGVSVDGGYAETMIAHQNALVSVPGELTPVETAPLLCGGLTIYRALLKTSRARRGDVVAVYGADSFGLLTLQFARHMGFRATVYGRGTAPSMQAVDGAAAIIPAPSSELQIASPSELRDVLEFCVAKKIRPLVETSSLVETSDVYRSVMRGTAAFRVIDSRFLAL